MYLASILREEYAKHFSLSSCCVRHWDPHKGLQHILREASSTVKASFAINNGKQWFLFILAFIIWITCLNEVMASTTLTISRSPVFTSCYNSASSTGLITITPITWAMEDPQGTSLLRNDFWFLYHKETLIFTLKTSASVTGLGHWFDSEKSVSISGLIPTGNRKWKLEPEIVKLQGIRLQCQREHGTNQ